MFGLSFEKLLIVAVIAAFVIGPERLPRYAAKFGEFVRNMRDFANNAKSRVREEMGDEFNDVDWKKLDPRQYDPRRIIRDALLDTDPAPAAAIASPPAVIAAPPPQQRNPLTPGAVPPFDPEST